MPKIFSYHGLQVQGQRTKYAPANHSCSPRTTTFMAKIKCVKVRALLEKNKVRLGAFKSAFTISLKLFLWYTVYKNIIHTY